MKAGKFNEMGSGLRVVQCGIERRGLYCLITCFDSGWKCSKCDMRENLWLNMTDGSILCGRRYFDGSGGNNHAVEHYRETGYPLAVKLGTITPDGAGKTEPICRCSC